MSNRRELRKARKKLAIAQAELDGIRALPRRVGSQVEWSNGVVWERLGDDEWVALHEDGSRSTDDPEGGYDPEGTFTSAHLTIGTIIRTSETGGLR